MDTTLDEAIALGDTEARDLALEIRNRDREYQASRSDMLWRLAAVTYTEKHPPLRMSDIITVVDAAPDEEAQLQTVMVKLSKRGDYNPLLVELAIATIGPHDTDSIIDFVNPLDVKNIKHIEAASGKRLFECTSCEDSFLAKDLITTPCGHCYCGSCLNMVFKAAVSDESLYPPSCCDQTPIPIEHAKRFLDRGFETTFEKKGVEFNTLDRTYCSDPECSTFIPPNSIRSETAYCWDCGQATCVEDDWTIPPAEWGLGEPFPAPIWVGEPEENPVQQEQDRSRAGTPDMPDFEWPDEQFVEDINRDLQRAIAEAQRRPPDQPPGAEAVGNATNPDADTTLLQLTPDDTLINMLRQSITVASAQYSILLNQDHENENPYTKSRASNEDVLERESIPDVQLPDGSDSREESAQSDHNSDGASEYQNSEHSSSVSMQPARHSRLRTKLSPRRLLRTLRKAGMSVLRRREITSSCSNKATVE
ncbi:unnamed protein product [Aureobasidium mustum]|uniref:RING-type domain-containing protein n=1 Tax=Aureobasidium mustum TaxID=2773714 RepID=A0A9N8K180_9PEZI|nr:unnamed protein product [Aureobasidium mustum]